MLLSKCIKFGNRALKFKSLFSNFTYFYDILSLVHRKKFHQSELYIQDWRKISHVSYMSINQYKYPSYFIYSPLCDYAGIKHIRTLINSTCVSIVSKAGSTRCYKHIPPLFKPDERPMLSLKRSHWTMGRFRYSCIDATFEGKYKCSLLRLNGYTRLVHMKGGTWVQTGIIVLLFISIPAKIRLVLFRLFI